MKTDRSFGVIVVKNKQILMTNRPKAEGWDFPKGHANENESDVMAAIREVEEETGYVCYISPLGRLFFIDYFYEKDKEEIHKHCYFWLGSLIGKGNTNFDDSEMERHMTCEWVDKNKVASRIEFLPFKELWEEVRNYV